MMHTIVINACVKSKGRGIISKIVDNKDKRPRLTNAASICFHLYTCTIFILTLLSYIKTHNYKTHVSISYRIVCKQFLCRTIVLNFNIVYKSYDVSLVADKNSLCRSISKPTRM